MKLSSIVITSLFTCTVLCAEAQLEEKKFYTWDIIPLESSKCVEHGRGLSAHELDKLIGGFNYAYSIGYIAKILSCNEEFMRLGFDGLESHAKENGLSNLAHALPDTVLYMLRNRMISIVFNAEGEETKYLVPREREWF